MTINVRFFASLRERIGHATVTVEADGIATARDVWKAVSGESPDEEMLVAINKEYAGLDEKTRQQLRSSSTKSEFRFLPDGKGSGWRA